MTNTGKNTVWKDYVIELNPSCFVGVVRIMGRQRLHLFSSELKLVVSVVCRLVCSSGRRKRKEGIRSLTSQLTLTYLHCAGVNKESTRNVVRVFLRRSALKTNPKCGKTNRIWTFRKYRLYLTLRIFAVKFQMLGGGDRERDGRSVGFFSFFVAGFCVMIIERYRKKILEKGWVE